jgi:hypothetical protein
MVCLALLSACHAGTQPGIGTGSGLNSAEQTPDVWKSEPFGNDGEALMLVQVGEDGQLWFDCYIYQYDEYLGGRSLALNKFSAAAAGGNGEYPFLVSENTGFKDISEFSGIISLKNGIITLTYGDITFQQGSTGQFIEENGSAKIVYDNMPNIHLPTKFTLMLEDEPGETLYSFPFFAGEISLPFADELTSQEADAIFGEPIETVVDEYLDGIPLFIRIYDKAELWIVRIQYADMPDPRYRVVSFSSEDPDLIPNVRDIKMGDDIRLLISRFMCTVGNYDDLLKANATDEGIALYGAMSEADNFGRINFLQNMPVSIDYIDDWKMIRYRFDDAGRITKIEYRWFLG